MFLLIDFEIIEVIPIIPPVLPPVCPSFITLGPIISLYNAFIFKNFNITYVSVEGRLAIGGNASFEDANIATKLFVPELSCINNSYIDGCFF